jgi:hypothetical protein
MVIDDHSSTATIHKNDSSIQTMLSDDDTFCAIKDKIELILTDHEIEPVSTDENEGVEIIYTNKQQEEDPMPDLVSAESIMNNYIQPPLITKRSWWKTLSWTPRRFWRMKIG